MVMTIDQFKEKQNSLRLILASKQLQYIHSQSVDNFLKYINHFKEGGIKDQIIKYLEAYFYEIEIKDYLLTKDESDHIFRKYIMSIGTFYKEELDFKIYKRPKWAIFLGIHIDLLLLVLGILKRVYYLPIATILLGGYFIYLEKIFGKRNKLYGLRY